MDDLKNTKYKKTFEKHVTPLSIRLHEIYTTDNINSDFNKQK